MEQGAQTKGGFVMVDLPENLAEYSATHRNRERHENGYVKLVGKLKKKWEGSYHVYKLQPDGSEKRSRLTRIIGTKAEIPTKAEAEDLHRAWIRRQASQPVANNAKAKVSHLCDDYLALRNGDWEEATRKTNQSVFARIIKPAIGERPIDTVTAEDLKRLVNGLPNRTYEMSGRLEREPDGKVRRLPGAMKKGISHSYAKKVITHLRALFDFAQERDLITKNPARSINVRLRMPKQARKPDKTVFPPQYLPALLAQMTPRDRLITWLSILGATRPNELFAVLGSDVGPGWVHIGRALDRRRCVKATKTGTARFIHLPPELTVEVHEWMAAERIGPEDLLFQNRDGNPLNRANFLKRRLRPAAVRAKTPVQDLDFQMLRRSFATVARLVGLDVKAIQSQLGHSRPDMTVGEYMQPIDALTAGQLKRLEDMMRGREPIPVDVAAKIGTVVIQ
jgi:integrase